MIRPLPTDLPCITPDTELPGGWVASEDGGPRIWRGGTSWLTRCGETTLLWLLATPRYAWNALLPDGTRGEADNVDRLTGLGWRRPAADGRWIYGTVVIDGSGARFIDREEQTKPTELESTEEPDLEADMARSNDILVAVQDDDFARALYAALCNSEWRRNQSNMGHRWGCTWRSAGETVADLRDRGEIYLDFYLSGNEGFIREDVRIMLDHLGWHPLSPEEIAADHDWAIARLAELEAAPAAGIPDWYRKLVSWKDHDPVEPQRNTVRDRLHHLGWSGRVAPQEWHDLWSKIDIRRMNQTS